MNQEKLQKLQFLEQNLQAFYMQRQAFDLELSETKTTISEIEKTKEPVYKLIGQLLIKVDSKKILDEMKNKEKLLELRLKTFLEQQNQFEEQAKKLRQELTNSQK